jgi:hypothetical protein
MDEIKVKKPPATAFNPNRPASDLLREQVRHLEWAVRHAGERRTDFHRVKYVKTEADAALRMQQLLPRLASADKLPFTAASLQEAAAMTAPKYRAPKKATKKPAKSKSKPAKKSKRAGKAKRPKKAEAKR